MKVHGIMTKQVRSCGADDSMADAARLMWEGDCGSIPVVDDGGHVVGMITDRDICMATFTRGVPPAALKVSDAMNGTVTACRSDDDVESAEQLMASRKVRRLPVMDGAGRLVG